MAAPFAQAQKISRDEVKQEFLEAKSYKMLVQNGEMAETDQVLGARDAFNRRQTEQIAALAAERRAAWAAYEEAEARRLAWVREQELLATQKAAADEEAVAMTDATR